MLECEGVFTAGGPAHTAGSARRPDDGPAVALCENYTLHKSLKQTRRVELRLGAGGWDTKLRAPFEERFIMYLQQTLQSARCSWRILATDG